MGGTKESIVQKQIVEAYRKMGVMCWRQNSGMVKSGQHFIRLGVPGTPDIIGYLPHGGTFFGIEVKSNGEPLTDVQQEFIDRINTAGGVAVVVKSYDEAIGVMVELLKPDRAWRRGW